MGASLGTVPPLSEPPRSFDRASTHCERRSRPLPSIRNALVRCRHSRPGGAVLRCSRRCRNPSRTLIGDYGYVAIFVLMVLESACIPIPSEVTMLFGGALASPGFAAPGHELDLVLVALVGTLGNLVGSWLAYGRAAGGRPLWIGSAGTC